MMRRNVTLLFLTILAVTGLGGVLPARLPARAQDAPTAAPLDLPTYTLTPEGGVTATPTYTPSPPGLAYAEAIDEANVRSGPGVDFGKVGTIYSGGKYVVLGVHRDYPWVQIQFEDSSSKTAWVYRDLVELTGNVADIPVIEPEALPTQNPLLMAMQETLQVLTLTPGALGTATAMAGLFPGGVSTAPADQPTPTRPPTFTPPPLGPTQLPSYQSLAARTGSDNGLGGLPPAVPIIVLAVLGIMGLVVSILRRMF
ncbi:MAG: SH3 domain-containing protein [Anaerolineae bacterium]|nr:SH3 domain-containing protein [Anaerolineae bacterium]